MHDGWFFAVGETPVGPLSFDDLVVALRQFQDPANVSLWHASFGVWCFAKDVPQVAEYILRLPFKTPPKPGDRPDPTRGRIAFLIVALVVLGVGATYSTLIYDNSGEGIGYLFGHLMVMTLALSAFVFLAFRRPRSPYTAAFVLGIAALSVGISDFGKLRAGITAREATQALQHVRDPSRVQTAPDQKSSKVPLEMFAKIALLAEETNRLALKMSDEVKPPDINLATASRAELEAYHRDLQMAAANAATFMPRYTDLLNDERAKSERIARTLRLDEDFIRNLLSGIDGRHERFSAFNMKLLSARTEFYRVYANQIAFLIEQFGAYKVEKGQFLFRDQSIADRYNATANALAAAAKRVAEVEIEGQQLLRLQTEGWERFVAGHDKLAAPGRGGGNLPR